MIMQCPSFELDIQPALLAPPTGEEQKRACFFLIKDTLLQHLPLLFCTCVLQYFTKNTRE